MKISEETFREVGRSLVDETEDDAEDRNYFCSNEGDFMYRHHNETSGSALRPERRNIPNTAAINLT